MICGYVSFGVSSALLLSLAFLLTFSDDFVFYLVGAAEFAVRCVLRTTSGTGVKIKEDCVERVHIS